jgi:filamentous hemagglutinin
LNGQGGTLLGNGTLTLTGQTTDLSNGTTSAQRIRITTGDLTTAGGQLSATSTDTLQLQVRNRLDNTGGTLGSNGAVDLTAASFINNQGALQAAGAGNNRLDVAGALENRSGSILTAGNATVEAGALDNRGGTLHAGQSDRGCGVQRWRRGRNRPVAGQSRRHIGHRGRAHGNNRRDDQQRKWSGAGR